MCIIHFTSLRILQWIGTSCALTGCFEQFLWTTTCVDSLFLLHFFSSFSYSAINQNKKDYSEFICCIGIVGFRLQSISNSCYLFMPKFLQGFLFYLLRFCFLFWLHTTQPRMRHTHKKLHEKHSNSNLFQYFVQISSADSNTCFAIVISVFLPVNCYFHLKKNWKHLTIDWLMFFTPRLLPLLLHSYFIW